MNDDELNNDELDETPNIPKKKIPDPFSDDILDTDEEVAEEEDEEETDPTDDDEEEDEY
jgi:hypothetical protein